MFCKRKGKTDRTESGGRPSVGIRRRGSTKPVRRPPSTTPGRKGRGYEKRTSYTYP